MLLIQNFWFMWHIKYIFKVIIFIVSHVVKSFDGSNVNEAMFTLSTCLKCLWPQLPAVHCTLACPFLDFFLTSVFIKIQFTYYTIHLLKVCNSLVFSIFTYLLMFLSLLSPALLLGFLWPTSQLKSSFIKKLMIWNDLVLLLVKCHKEPSLSKLECATLVAVITSLY